MKRVDTTTALKLHVLGYKRTEEDKTYTLYNNGNVKNFISKILYRLFKIGGGYKIAIPRYDDAIYFIEDKLSYRVYVNVHAKEDGTRSYYVVIKKIINNGLKDNISLLGYWSDSREDAFVDAVDYILKNLTER